MPHLDYDQDPPVGVEIEVCLHVVTVSALLTVSIPDRMPRVNVFKIIIVLHPQFFILPFSSFLHDSGSVAVPDLLGSFVYFSQLSAACTLRRVEKTIFIAASRSCISAVC